MAKSKTIVEICPSSHDTYYMQLDGGLPWFHPNSENCIDKMFIGPFQEKNYFESKSYDDVFQLVNKQIQQGIYWRGMNGARITPRSMVDSKGTFIDFVARDLEKRDMLVVNSIHSYPTLFEMDSPIPRLLVSHFGRLLNTAIYSKNSKERSHAQRVINKILKRPTKFASGQKSIPQKLYIKGFCEYLHKITKHLQIKIRQHALDVKLDKMDPRLKVIVKRQYLGVLKSRQWREVTKLFLAEFLGLTVQGLDAALKAESRLISNKSQKRTTRKG